MIEGDSKGGFSIFYPDDGLDTGPLLLQRECDIGPNETVDTIYKSFMYPEGIKAMAEAVDMIGKGEAPCIVQKEEGATYDAYLNKPELCRYYFLVLNTSYGFFPEYCDQANFCKDITLLIPSRS